MTAARRTLEDDLGAIVAGRESANALDFSGVEWKTFDRLLAIAQGQREEIARLVSIVAIMKRDAVVEYSDDGKNWVRGYACIYANENGFTWGNRFYKHARPIGTKK